MSQQVETTSHPATTAPRGSRLPFVLTVMVCAVTALCVYLWARGRSSGQTSERQVKLALVTWNNDAFWDPVIRGAEDAAQEWNVDLATVRSTPEVDTQSKHVRDLLAKGVDGIAISPNNPQAQATLLDEAAAKTALITFDSDAPDSKRRLFVGTDDYAAGQWAAEEVKRVLPDGGTVIISVGSVDTVNGRDRRQGVIDSLLDRPFDRTRKADPTDAPLKGPRYTVAATVLDGADQAKAPALVAAALNAHPDARCVVGLWSYSAGAVLKGIEQAGKGGRVNVIAFDESPETQAGIEAGTVQASILQDQYRIGYEAVRILAASVRGLEQRGPQGPRLTHMPIYVLNRDNLEDFRRRERIRRPAATSQPAQPAATAQR